MYFWYFFVFQLLPLVIETIESSDRYNRRGVSTKSCFIKACHVQSPLSGGALRCSQIHHDHPLVPLSLIINHRCSEIKGQKN